MSRASRTNLNLDGPSPQFGVLKNLQPYDEVRYVTALKNLPELPE